MAAARKEASEQAQLTAELATQTGQLAEQLAAAQARAAAADAAAAALSSKAEVSAFFMEDQSNQTKAPSLPTEMQDLCQGVFVGNGAPKKQYTAGET